MQYGSQHCQVRSSESRVTDGMSMRSYLLLLLSIDCSCVQSARYENRAILDTWDPHSSAACAQAQLGRLQ